MLDVAQPETMRAVEFDVATPRFGANSPAELHDGVNFLRRHGYAVFKNVGTRQQVNTGVDLMWDYLEALGVGIVQSIAQLEPATWRFAGHLLARMCMKVLKQTTAVSSQQSAVSTRGP